MLVFLTIPLVNFIQIKLNGIMSRIMRCEGNRITKYLNVSDTISQFTLIKKLDNNHIVRRWSLTFTMHLLWNTRNRYFQSRIHGYKLEYKKIVCIIISLLSWCWIKVCTHINPYNAEILLYNPWRAKGFFQFEIIIKCLRQLFLLHLNTYIVWVSIH